MQLIERRLTAWVRSGEGTAFYITLLKERYKETYNRREDEEEDVSSYWMTLQKGEVIGNWKRKH